MPPRGLNPAVITLLIAHVCLILICDPGSRDRRVRSTLAVDPTPIVAPRHLQGKKGVGISPTRKKI